MASCLTLALASSATANPSGPTVRHGQVQITPGAQAQIQQLTDRAIVDWQSFSIGIGESVQFLQPGQLSVILNRVTGVDPSQILGSLSANGQVFLINPNGILFGPNSTVNVGGLVASTLNISNEDFLSGNYSFFTEDGQDLAAVVNQGTIRITDGGYAVLTGPSVINEGTIVARTGSVVLASGEQATLNLDGRDLVHFALVGQVSDGTVLLAPGVLSESLAQTFGIKPELRADKLVQMPDGSVRMVNSSGTTVQNGTVSVDGRSGENAGNVLLDSGDVTIVGQGSRTTADGIGADSDGGDILVLSSMDASATTRGFTDVQAGSRLSARGGESGDGGFIEVSGDGINLHGDFTLAAENGRAGDFLLDPVLVTIVDGDNAPTTVTNPLTLSSNTIIGDAWFESASFSGFSSFTLESTGDILFDLGTQGTNPTGDLAINFRGGAGSVALTLTAGTDAVEIGGIDFGDDGISLTGLSSLNLQADGEIALGDATFDIDGPLRINTTNGANVSLGSAQIDLDSNTNSNPVNIFADGDLDLGTSFLDIREFGHSAAMQIEAGGNIDFGSAGVVITSQDPGGTVDVVSTTVRAGGDIFSDPADGNAGTFTNTFTAAGSTLFEAGGSINLPDLNLTVVKPGSAAARLDIDALGGTLTLTESQITVDQTADITSSSDMNLGNLDILANLNGDIILNSGGSLTFLSGSVNQGALSNATNNETGGLDIDAVGDIGLGSTTIEIDTNSAAPLNIDSSTGNLDLGTADIRVREQGGSAAVLLEADGNVDLGSADVLFTSLENGFTVDVVSTTVRAGGDIFSDPADGNTGTFINTIAAAGTTLLEAGGSINLPDLNLTVVKPSSAATRLDIDALGGTLTLTESQITVDQTADITSSSDMNLGNLDILANLNGDIILNSGGSLTFLNGSVNQGALSNATNNETGGLDIDAVGDISLGATTIEIDTNSSSSPLNLDSSTGNLELGTADVRIREEGGSATVLLEAGGHVDLGSADVLFTSLENGFTVDDVSTTVRAGGDIFSDLADGNAGTFTNTFAAAGVTLLEAGGSINLPDLNLTVVKPGSSATRLDIDALGGTLTLTESQITVDQTADITSSSDMNLGNLDILANLDGDIILNSGGSLTFLNGSVNQGALSNATNNETGSLDIDAVGDISLGSTTIEIDTNSAASPLNIDSSTGNLDLGTADIRVREQGGSAAILLEADGDVDLGSADVLFTSLGNGGTVDVVSTTVRAGGDIRSDPADGNTGTFTNTIAAAGTTLLEAGGSINLPDLNLTVVKPGSSAARLDVNALGGALTLSESEIDVNGSASLSSNSDMTLGSLDINVDTDGNIALNSGGNLTFTDGSINKGALMTPTGKTGNLDIDAVGDISLGSTTIELDTNTTGSPLNIKSGGTLDLGTADIDIREFGGSANVLLQAAVDLDLGSAGLEFISLPNGGTVDVVSTLIQAGRNILGDAADLDIDQRLQIDATGGDITLGQSTVTVADPNGDLLVVAAGDFNAQQAQVTVADRLSFGVGGSFNADGSMMQAADLEIFGFNTGTSLPDPLLPVGGSVTLNLVTQDASDVLQFSIFSSGDITVGHSGPGTILAERADADVSGSASPYAVRSQGGNITIQGENRLVLGGGNATFASIHSDDTGTNSPVVFVGGREIVDSNPALDIFSPGEIVIQATRSAGAGNALEVRGEAITLDMSQLESGFLDNFADIIIDNGTLDLKFLNVSGNNSDITIVEAGVAGPQFRVEPVSTGPNLLSIEALAADNFLYTEYSAEGIQMETVEPGSGKKVSIETINGDILGGSGIGDDALFDGDLLLISGGNIGTQGDSVRVESSRVAAQAAGDVFLESQSDELVIADQIVVETFTGAGQPSGQGVQAQGDIEIALVDSGGLSVRNLRLDGDVASTNGGVALVVPDGDLIQTAGEISGPTVALQVGGNTGTFDENAPASATEIAIDAGALVLDVGSDVVLHQADGNLRFETQAVIGGGTYTTTGAGDDLRVRVGSGDMTVNADLTSGGDLGLVTGSTSVVAQALPGNIILNGNLKADGNDLVLIASGNIVHQSGTITSARLGLGANGSIGTAAAPLNIEADDLAVNPFGASVNDPTGFQTVGSVTATGLTVNQGAPPPPAPPEPEPPTPTPPEVGPIPNPTSEPLIPEVIAEEVGRNEEILLVQNQVDLVENVLELLIESNQEIIEPDPTRVPFPITDDDFLRKKFRR